MSKLSRSSPLTLSAFVIVASSGAAWAQAAGTRVAFSIDYRSGHVGVPNCASPVPITDGDVLTACTAGGIPAYGPLPAPRIAIPGGGGPGSLGLPMYPGCVGHPAGTPCGIDVDALSSGADFPVIPQRMLAGTYVFSVDRCSLGVLAPLAPNVTSEGPVGDAPADIFQDRGLPPGPIPPGPAIGNSGIIDGNGMPSGSGAVYPGLGLFEPSAVFMPFLDDLDALDIDPLPAAVAAGLYFSLDAAFPDPCTGLPNSGSGPANGFPGAAVLWSPLTGAPPVVYAAPAALGLNLLGPGTDDLDALALSENGMPGYQPSLVPYDWLPNTAGVVPTDMLLYSVRRGSAVIGMPDSNFGIPIEAGDILTTPRVGGLSPFPAIFISAEWLGLRTLRTNGIADDLNALDTVYHPQTAVPYCFGTAALCPCGNAGAPGNGCANSNFGIGSNLTATGSASVTADTVVITCTNMPNGFSLMFQGTAQASAVFGDGLRCVAGVVQRFPVRPNVANSNFYPNPLFLDPPLSVMGGIPAAGGTRFYQSWYRDALPFCTPNTFNLSNAVTIVWTP
jgi:hypothetical protein